ncbi:MAG: DUF4136 domain-containing protein [bacterium]
MKKNTIIILLIGSVILGFMGCASVRVNVNYDESVVFSDYRTFAFVRPRQQQMARRNAVRDPLITEEMMEEIRPIMESKGFVEAGSQEEADLLVVFYAAVHNQREFVPPTYRVGRWGRVWSARPGHFVNYKEGTLVIDMVDQTKKELVWQGVGSGVLDRVQPARNLVEAVAKILEKFPPEK